MVVGVDGSSVRASSTSNKNDGVVTGAAAGGCFRLLLLLLLWLWLVPPPRYEEVVEEDEEDEMIRAGSNKGTLATMGPGSDMCQSMGPIGMVGFRAGGGCGDNE